MTVAYQPQNTRHETITLFQNGEDASAELLGQPIVEIADNTRELDERLSASVQALNTQAGITGTPRSVAAGSIAQQHAALLAHINEVDLTYAASRERDAVFRALLQPTRLMAGAPGARPCAFMANPLLDAANFNGHHALLAAGTQAGVWATLDGTTWQGAGWGTGFSIGGSPAYAGTFHGISYANGRAYFWGTGGEIQDLDLSELNGSSEPVLDMSLTRRKTGGQDIVGLTRDLANSEVFALDKAGYVWVRNGTAWERRYSTNTPPASVNHACLTAGRRQGEPVLAYVRNVDTGGAPSVAYTLDNGVHWYATANFPPFCRRIDSLLYNGTEWFASGVHGPANAPVGAVYRSTNLVSWANIWIDRTPGDPGVLLTGPNAITRRTHLTGLEHGMLFYGQSLDERTPVYFDYRTLDMHAMPRNSASFSLTLDANHPVAYLRSSGTGTRWLVWPNGTDIYGAGWAK